MSDSENNAENSEDTHRSILDSLNSIEQINADHLDAVISAIDIPVVDIQRRATHLIFDCWNRYKITSAALLEKLESHGAQNTAIYDIISMFHHMLNLAGYPVDIVNEQTLTDVIIRATKVIGNHYIHLLRQYDDEYSPSAQLLTMNPHVIEIILTIISFRCRKGLV